MRCQSFFTTADGGEIILLPMQVPTKMELGLLQDLNYKWVEVHEEFEKLSFR